MDRDEDGNSSGSRRWPGLVAVIVAVLGVGLAAFVVVRNAGRIQLAKPPVAIEHLPPEVEVARFRSSMRRRLARLERRYHKFRVADLTPAQDSLAHGCDSAFSRLREAVAALDTVDAPGTAADIRQSAIDDYRTLLRLVSRFIRSLASTPELDSLDAQLRQLLSE